MSLPDQTGKQVPQAKFKIREGYEWVEKTTDDFFKGKKVVLFALPGAFTPTCSSTHLPRYNELYEAFKEAGVDDVICLSVNDSFVMNDWKRDQNAKNITMLPDGNGEFSEKLGFLVDKSDLGFGKRSWRYSMLVNDGKIEKMFIEEEKPGDPFNKSDADTMLKYLDGKRLYDSISDGIRNLTLHQKTLDEINVFPVPAVPYATRCFPSAYESKSFF